MQRIVALLGGEGSVPSLVEITLRRFSDQSEACEWRPRTPDGAMKKARFTKEQMVAILREADARPLAQVANERGVSAQTIHGWRKRFRNVEARECEAPPAARAGKRSAEKDGRRPRVRVDALKEPTRRRRVFDHCLNDSRLSGGQDIPAGNARVVRALEFIQSHSTRPTLTVGEVATACSISRWHLVRLLRAQTGKTYIDWVRESRMRLALTLLRDTTANIKEIAWRVGYTFSHFDRDFKRLFGLSPREWRDRQSAQRLVVDQGGEG